MIRTKEDPLGIGVMVRFNDSPQESFRRLREMGLRHCQLAAPSDDYLYGATGRRNTRILCNAAEEADIAVTSLFISFPDQDWKDWRNGIGLVPPHTRAERMARACRSADWGAELGITQIASHVGCVPEEAADPEYAPFVRAMRGFCRLLEANGQYMAYETGQEPVAVLKRLIDDIGVDNQRINFDPANLLLYNHDAPAELVRVMGEKIIHIHCKDGNRPRNGAALGAETRLGEGETDFVNVLTSLLDTGYRGPLTIEREIAAGAELNKDMCDAIELLQVIKARYGVKTL